jgi:hypothetical protein
MKTNLVHHQKPIFGIPVVRILNVPDEVLERPEAAADGQVITEYVDSEKWCGDQRTKYAVLKVEATSFGLAVICGAFALVLVT